MIKLFRDKPSKKFYLAEHVAKISDFRPKQAAKAFDQLAAAERLDADGIERIEELISELKKRFTIIIVTHNMGQAKRASDECIYMYLGKIIEHSTTESLFLNPKEEQTAMYIEGRYG